MQPEENYNEEWAAYKANWINLNKEFLNQDYLLWVDILAFLERTAWMLVNRFIVSLFDLQVAARSGSVHSQRAKRHANLKVGNLSRNIWEKWMKKDTKKKQRGERIKNNDGKGKDDSDICAVWQQAADGIQNRAREKKNYNIRS